MTETVIDTSTSSLFQQGFKSLEEIMKNRYSAALFRNISSNITARSLSLSLTFLISLACFLWATVDLAGRGWFASVVMLGLISFAVCCCAFLRGDTCSCSGWAEVCRRAGEPPIYVGPARQRGGNTSHCVGGVTQGGDAFGRWAVLLSGPSGPVGPLRLPLVCGVLRWYCALLRLKFKALTFVQYPITHTSHMKTSFFFHLYSVSDSGSFELFYSKDCPFFSPGLVIKFIFFLFIGVLIFALKVLPKWEIKSVKGHFGLIRYLKVALLKMNS